MFFYNFNIFIIMDKKQTKIVGFCLIVGVGIGSIVGVIANDYTYSGLGALIGILLGGLISKK